MTSKLLIVVPTLDSFSILPRLCDSLRNQSWLGWSVLFVDGPSSSDHREWLEHCCASDSRFSWIPQQQDCLGIFGAMNQGFAAASRYSVDWLLFWGSDDWAPSSSVLAQLFAAVDCSHSQSSRPDLVVCRGRYVRATGQTLKRSTVFHSHGFLDVLAYRRALWHGASPPHQATLFTLGVRQHLAGFASEFHLSADLDYFLRLSSVPSLYVQCLDLELVHMSDCGVSDRQTLRRLNEVRRAYFHAFSWLWWFPFLMRYVRRTTSLLQFH
jgi:glycosyltransferase involved in cell wall biosynthesis